MEGNIQLWESSNENSTWSLELSASPGRKGDQGLNSSKMCTQVVLSLAWGPLKRQESGALSWFHISGWFTQVLVTFGNPIYWMTQSVPTAVEDTGAAILTKQNPQSLVSHRRVRRGSEPGPWGTFLPIPCYSHQSIASAQTKIKGSLPQRIAREATGSSGWQRQAYPNLAWGKGLG